MGVFVTPLSNVFAEITNAPTTILTASSNVLLVNSISICNLGTETIRFNLQKIRTQANPVTLFRVNQFVIAPSATVDIVAEIGLQIMLEYSITPSISDSLVCFSNGYTQIFSCEITYTQLNELPFY